jgi:transcriptional regulator with XRE-family HTH domain
MSAAKAIAYRRAHRSLSYRELGKRTGLSAGYLCDVEKGRKGLSAAAALAVGRALDLDPLSMLIEQAHDGLRRARKAER